MKNSGFSITKSVANLKISWSFLLEKILRSTRTLDCDKYRLKLKGRFFSFCWAIFLYFSTPISWVMIRNVIKSTFCGHFASMGTKLRIYVLLIFLDFIPLVHIQIWYNTLQSSAVSDRAFSRREFPVIFRSKFTDSGTVLAVYNPDKIFGKISFKNGNCPIFNSG